MTITRFAPSPTGRLHRGHAFSALFAATAARRVGGRFLLRIEDIDATRCRPEFEAGIFEDLAWLGLAWETPVRRQSEHMGDYAEALARLVADGLLYRCFCTRADIAREIAAAGGAPHGKTPFYPGTCRHLARDAGDARAASGAGYALRLDVGAAFARTGELVWRDRDAGPQRVGPGLFGDVVLARKDVPASYHLAATLDDCLQGVTLVTRGQDLFAATHVHRLLQALLGLATPEYRHHALLHDAAGNRLAKRAGAASLANLRATGTDPRALVRELGFFDFI
jgi:glutamyl-Q tRNA(Asp) synthetase